MGEIHPVVDVLGWVFWAREDLVSPDLRAEEVALVVLGLLTAYGVGRGVGDALGDGSGCLD